MIRLLLSTAAMSLALASCGEPATTTTNVDVNESTTPAVTTTTDYTNTNPGTGIDGMAVSGTEAQPSTPQGYVAAAASSDQFEIQSSELVLAQSTNADVKRFAQKMLDDHRASSEKLMTAAQQAALTAPDAQMTAAHQTKLDELRAAGTNIDHIYLAQQRVAHAEAIALHQNMVKNTGMPRSLGNFARDTLPGLEAHTKSLAAINVTPAAR